MLVASGDDFRPMNALAVLCGVMQLALLTGGRAIGDVTT